MEELSKYKSLWIVFDCKWKTVRGVYASKNVAEKVNPCKKCLKVQYSVTAVKVKQEGI